MKKIKEEVKQQNYPQHEKLKLIGDKSQAIGEFLEWVNSRGYTLGKYDQKDYLMPVRESIPALLADYFEIDSVKLEEEKCDMLESLRNG